MLLEEMKTNDHFAISNVNISVFLEQIRLRRKKIISSNALDFTDLVELEHFACNQLSKTVPATC